MENLSDLLTQLRANMRTWTMATTNFFGEPEVVKINDLDADKLLRALEVADRALAVVKKWGEDATAEVSTECLPLDEIVNKAQAEIKALLEGV